MSPGVAGTHIFSKPLRISLSPAPADNGDFHRMTMLLLLSWWSSTGDGVALHPMGRLDFNKTFNVQ
jgi:hypothetical protein